MLCLKNITQCAFPSLPRAHVWQIECSAFCPLPIPSGAWQVWVRKRLILALGATSPKVSTNAPKGGLGRNPHSSPPPIIKLASLARSARMCVCGRGEGWKQQKALIQRLSWLKMWPTYCIEGKAVAKGCNGFHSAMEKTTRGSVDWQRIQQEASFVQYVACYTIKTKSSPAPREPISHQVDRDR